MSYRSAWVAALAMALATVALFHFLQRKLALSEFALSGQPEVEQLLADSLEDQKRLAEHEPSREASYRERFDEIDRAVGRLQVLEHSRADLVRRYELVLLTLLGATVLLVGGVFAVRQSRHHPRLEKLSRALGELAQGSVDVEVGVTGRDTIGRIAAMVERTSRVMARDRRRLAALQNLSAWQEAARRHAHEMRTPLTGAQLELARIEDLATEGSQEQAQRIRQAARGAAEELDRLKRFTRHFTSFARLPRPQLARQDLGQLVEDFCATYEGAWPNLRLHPEAEGPLAAAVDRDMLRQVLVNLCDNAALALGEKRGSVTFRLGGDESHLWLWVSDDGPGICEAVRPRLFEPYTTTRTIGEGMGLGLAISKKILLDHGGDLELAASSPAGTTFRLTLPRNPESPGDTA